MKTALFTNFTTETYVGFWDGKPETFKPGESKYLPEFLARHYGKHLVNRELLRIKKDGSLVYPGGDRMTSPKRPDDVPVFVELFNKAVFIESGSAGEQQKTELQAEVEAMNKNKEVEKTGASSELQTPLGEDDDSEDAFKGKPNENNQPNP